MGPLLCIPAAWFLQEAWLQLRRRNWRMIVPEALLFLVLALFVNGDAYGLAARHDFSASWLRLGAYHAARGEVPQDGSRLSIRHRRAAALRGRPQRPRRAADAAGALARGPGIVQNRAYAIDPTSVRTLNNLAAWYEQADSLDVARRWIERARARQGEDIEVLYNAGIIHGRLGDFPVAEKTFRRLLQIEPGHLAGRLGLGKSLVMEKRSAEAARMLEQVVARDVRQAEAWYFLGVARLQVEDVEGARTAFSSCLEARPGYEPARKQIEILDRLAGGSGGLGITHGPFGRR